MEKPKLKLDHLEVSSFETGAVQSQIEQDRIYMPGTSYDPTAMTFCYYCPPRTYDMNCQMTIGQEVY